MNYGMWMLHVFSHMKNDGKGKLRKYREHMWRLHRDGKTPEEAAKAFDSYIDGESLITEEE